jgi:hypothetical protein
MSDNIIEGVTLVAEKDVEAGLLHIYADVLGQLVPVASEKLGLLGTHVVSPSGESDSPSDSKTSRSRKTS